MRRDAINTRYDRLRARSSREWNQLIADVQGLLSTLVQVDPETGSPLDRIDNSDDMKAITAACKEIEGQRDGARQTPYPHVEEFQDLVDKCWVQWAKAYTGLVEARYPRADSAAAWTLMKDYHYRLDLEAVFAASQNAAIEAAVDERKRRLAELRDRDFAQIEDARRRELNRANAQMENELAEGERRRRAAVAAVAGFLQSFGQGLQAAGNSSRPVQFQGIETAREPSTSTQSRATCFSDFDCGGPGMTCVKANYSTTGVCMRAVNSFGVQDFMHTPQLNSVSPKYPGPGDCHGPVDCPVGFQCDMASGRCVR